MGESTNTNAVRTHRATSFTLTPPDRSTHRVFLRESRQRNYTFTQNFGHSSLLPAITRINLDVLDIFTDVKMAILALTVTLLLKWKGILRVTSNCISNGQQNLPNAIKIKPQNYGKTQKTKIKTLSKRIQSPVLQNMSSQKIYIYTVQQKTRRRVLIVHEARVHAKSYAHKQRLALCSFYAQANMHAIFNRYLCCLFWVCSGIIRVIAFTCSE